MSFYSIAPLNSPITRPLIGGFIFYFAIYLMFTLKETYAPTILQHKAACIRKETNDLRYWGPGTSGLAFLSISVSTIAAILSKPLFWRIINTHPKDPVTSCVPPEATARVMTIGAILTPIS
ncbi:hypothetical protein COL922a_010928 [Colletotrichum nupharicola]|nr:hypothetical protein COL922a_010928 [Colletotrichum nupharicola]